MQPVGWGAEAESEDAAVAGVVAVAFEIEGWMTELELDWLEDQASRVGSVLEIGTWKGRSTAALAEGCAGPVVTVDPFDAAFYRSATYRPGAEGVDVGAVAWENLRGFDNVTIMRMSSFEAALELAGKKFEMVFIDGDHSEAAVRSDLELWRPRTTRLLCGHDRQLPGVAAALEGLDVYEGPDSIWWMNP